MIALARGSLVWMAAGLAAVSIGLAARPLPRRFAGDSGLPPPPAEAPESTAGAEFSVEDILALSPFGRLARPVDDAPSVETTMGLTLRGVVIVGGREGSGAIVSGPPGPARTYVVGDEIVPGALLAEVHGDHVVLSIDDRRETLAFPEPRARPDEQEQDPGQASGVDALRALVTGSDDTASEASGDAPDDAPADGGLEAAIADYRARIRDDPQAVLDGLGLVATGSGYRVAEAASKPLLTVGLEPGDLVAKVNGQQVGNIERDRDLFDDVTASGRARVEVERDGQRVVLTLPLR